MTTKVNNTVSQELFNKYKIKEDIALEIAILVSQGENMKAAELYRRNTWVITTDFKHSHYLIKAREIYKLIN